MSKPLSKGWIIALICVIVCAIVMFILLNFVFVVKDVKANLLKQSNNLTNEQIFEKVNEAELNIKGNSVFFYNRNKMKADIEKAVPEIEVINLEILFPNVLRINCEERIPVFVLSIQNSTYNYAVVDENFKVITNINTNTTYIPLKFKITSGEDYYLFNDLKPGDFVTGDEVNIVKSFLYQLKEYSTTESVLSTLFSEIEVYYSTSIDGGKLSMKFVSKNGYEIDVRDISNNTDNKIVKLKNIIVNDNLSENQVIE